VGSTQRHTRALRAIMRYLILLLLTFNSLNYLLACSCDRIDSSNVQDWIAEADFVVEGQYITNLNHNSEVRERWNSENKGFDVLFLVTRVIKGSISKDTIAIVQFENGSCLTPIEQDNKYIILGQQVLRFKCLDIEKPTKDSSGEYPPTDWFTPPSYVDEQGTMNYNYCDESKSNYWDKTVDNYLTLYTSYCTTYLASSRTGKLIGLK